MCFTDSKTENAIYGICVALLVLSILLMPFNKLHASAAICCVVVLTISATLMIHDATAATAPATENPNHRTAAAAAAAARVFGTPCAEPRPRPRRYATAPPARTSTAPPPPPSPPAPTPHHAHARFAADVPGNYLCGDDGAPRVLPLAMESNELVVDVTDEVRAPDDTPLCGPGVKVVPNLPPFPGVAQLTGESMWRLPEWPADQPSREETIAAVVSDLPECREENPRDVIRNKGLYGIKGNVSCDLLKRSAVADTGFIQPLGARNAFLAYNSYDQLHAKDQYMIPVTPQDF